MTQLQKLAEPFPPTLVKKAPQGKFGSYVSHSTVNERLLAIVGPFSYEIVEALYGYAPEVVGKSRTWAAREHAIIGCRASLTMEVDGRVITITEVGDVDEPAMNLDARNLKDASSDAFKRCAMRAGLGLHLWSQADYFLDDMLGGGTDE